MTLDEARELIAYDIWANGLVFAAASGLSEEQLRRDIPSSYPSVGATLAHIVSTEWVWLRRWLGESPRSAPAWVAAAELSELQSQMTAVESERGAFLAGLTDGDRRASGLLPDTCGSGSRRCARPSDSARGESLHLPSGSGGHAASPTRDGTSGDRLHRVCLACFARGPVMTVWSARWNRSSTLFSRGNARSPGSC